MLRFANLERAIEIDASRDHQFGAYWLTVQAWNEESRYELGRRAIEAQNMLDAVADPQHGVLR